MSSICVHNDLTFLLTDGIAVDWVNEKLYWTEATVGEVLVMDITQRQRIKLIDSYDGSTTRAIAVDPTTRYSDITIMSVWRDKLA